MHKPLQILHDWLAQEQQLGSPNPSNMVLATTTADKIPHCRIVAMREISEDGILFFTQRGTRKYQEITINPAIAATIWLPLQQRQVICEGIAQHLSHEENLHYWNTLPRDRQLRFASYAPTSGQPIASIADLEVKQQQLTDLYQNTEIPMGDYYCGIRLCPSAFYFYTLGKETFSEVIHYFCHNTTWQQQVLSP